MTDEPPPMSRPRVAAGALFFNDAGDILLVKPTYKDGWDIPGGYVEPGETPSEACEREIKEELDLDIPITRLLIVDWAPSDQEGDKVLFVFDGGVMSDDLQDRVSVPREELKTFAFQPAAAFHDLMPERLARRLAAAIVVRAESKCGYLEHGICVGT